MGYNKFGSWWSTFGYIWLSSRPGAQDYVARSYWLCLGVGEATVFWPLRFHPLRLSGRKDSGEIYICALKQQNLTVRTRTFVTFSPFPSSLKLPRPFLHNPYFSCIASSPTSCSPVTQVQRATCANFLTSCDSILTEENVSWITVSGCELTKHRISCVVFWCTEFDSRAE